MVMTAGAADGEPGPASFLRGGGCEGRVADNAAGHLGLVICASRAVQARQEHLYPGRATAVVHPGVDVPGQPLTRQAARHALGIGEEGTAVGVVGRIEPWKSQDIAVRMLARLKDATCTLALIGDRDSASWPGFTPEVDALAAGLGVAGRVVFTGHRDDASRLLPGLDVLVCASREEGFSLAVLEATASGVPSSLPAAAAQRT